jgi:hypothetical protein
MVDSSALSSNADEGVTWAMMVADPDTYGADKLWVVLKPIPVAVDSSEPDSDDDRGDPE